MTWYKEGRFMFRSRRKTEDGEFESINSIIILGHNFPFAVLFMGKTAGSGSLKRSGYMPMLP